MIILRKEDVLQFQCAVFVVLRKNLLSIYFFPVHLLRKCGYGLAVCFSVILAHLLWSVLLTSIVSPELPIGTSHSCTNYLFFLAYLVC